MTQPSGSTGALEATARAYIGSALFDRLARNVGTEGAIRAAFHRLLAYIDMLEHMLAEERENVDTLRARVAELEATKP